MLEIFNSFTAYIWDETHIALIYEMVTQKHIFSSTVFVLYAAYSVFVRWMRNTDILKLIISLNQDNSGWCILNEARKGVRCITRALLFF